MRRTLLALTLALFSFAIPDARGQQLRIKVVTTNSDSPNGTCSTDGTTPCGSDAACPGGYCSNLATPYFVSGVMIGANSVTTGTCLDTEGTPNPVVCSADSDCPNSGCDIGVAIISNIAPGAYDVFIPSAILDPNIVGSVTVAATDNGVTLRCAPGSPEGHVSVTFDASHYNPSASDDYVVGIRIVPMGAPALLNPDDCSQVPTRCSDPNLPVDCHAICCPAGATCNTVNSQVCCAPGLSVSCQNACCPAGYECGLDGASCSCSVSSGGARIPFFSGDVRVNGAIPVCGQTLQSGDLIEVAPGGMARITIPGSFPDPPLSCSLTGLGKSASIVFRPPGTLGDRIIMLIRGLLGIDGKGRHSVEALNTVIGSEGTKFSIDANPDTHEDTIAVTEDSVQVSPKNPALPPFRLNAGQQVDVGADAVSAITLLCLPGQCDDGNACTVDTCTPSACHNDPASGLDAVCSACQGGVKSPPCTGQPIPAMVAQRFTQACSLAARVGTSKPTKAKKLKQQAAANLRKANALVKKAAKRHKNPISANCAGMIAGILKGTF